MSILLALVPVLLMLTLLHQMDSFRMVRAAAVLGSIAAGMFIAGVCLSLHQWWFDDATIGLPWFTRYVAPATEEVLKAAFIVGLMWRRRIGFLVDAAVHGFAVGAGFALAENVDYLWHLTNAPLMLWLVRGLGTAVLHGTTTAVFAIVTKALVERRAGQLWRASLPGLTIAFVIHSAFNHVPLPPLAMTSVLLLLLPLLIIVVFQHSERATREWVGAGLDLDVELLDLVRSEVFISTRFGIYLQELRERFGGLAVVDMFCLLRLELELSVQAKAMLVAREAGLEIPVTDDLHVALREVEYLQSCIGRMGMLALRPLQISSDRDHWHRYLLAAAARS
jgi:RsiW-degrading membrane proteinase PrsW (M82 family)